MDFPGINSISVVDNGDFNNIRFHLRVKDSISATE
jgi:hypothetical protein